MTGVVELVVPAELPSTVLVEIQTAARHHPGDRILRIVVATADHGQRSLALGPRVAASDVLIAELEQFGTVEVRPPRIGQVVQLRVRAGARYDQMPANLRARLEQLHPEPGAARAAFERGDGTVVATRRRAREMIAANPEIDASRQVVLDARGVEVASCPFLDELVQAWPRAHLANFSEDVAVAWDIVIERRFP